MMTPFQALRSPSARIPLRARPSPAAPGSAGGTPRRRRTGLAIGAGLAFGAALLGSGAVSAQEITLRAVNGFQEGTYFARNFEAFVKKVNDEGKGVVQINYIGGPKAIPTFEQGNALRTCVVDLANTTTSFTASIIPEGLSLNYTDQTMAELRKNGTLEYLNTLFMEKGLYFFARTGEGIQYYIYSNKKIEKADLSGLKLRIAPIYRDFFQKQGATVVRMAPGEVFTGLEPGFYAIELGIQVVKLDDAQAKVFLKNAYDAGRDGIVKVSPVHGVTLRGLMAPK